MPSDSGAAVRRAPPRRRVIDGLPSADPRRGAGSRHVRPHAPGAPPSHLRDHLAPRRRQDDADREAAAVLRGAIQIAGSVKARKAARHATSDWMEIEKQRGISVTSSVLQFEYRGCVINLLDTPGHQDFSEDTYRVLTAVDAALMVIDAAKGVEPQTRKLLRGLPARATRRSSPSSTRWTATAASRSTLMDEIERDARHRRRARSPGRSAWASDFHGVYDLREQQMRVFRPGEDARRAAPTSRSPGSTTRRMPSASARSARSSREEIELLTAPAPPFDREAFLAGQLTPMFFGSAINNFGVRELPRRVDRDGAAARAPREAIEARGRRPDEPTFSGFVFKIQANFGSPARPRDRIALCGPGDGAEIDQRIEHLAHAEVVDRRAEEHRSMPAGEEGLAVDGGAPSVTQLESPSACAYCRPKRSAYAGLRSPARISRRPCAILAWRKSAPAVPQGRHAVEVLAHADRPGEGRPPCRARAPSVHQHRRLLDFAVLLLTKVRIGVLRARQTCSSRRVCARRRWRRRSPSARRRRRSARGRCPPRSPGAPGCRAG